MASGLWERHKADRETRLNADTFCNINIFKEKINPHHLAAAILPEGQSLKLRNGEKLKLWCSRLQLAQT